MSDDELYARMRQAIPAHMRPQLDLCVLTAKQMDCSVIRRSTANGYETRDGRKVTRETVPRHTGGNFSFKILTFFEGKT